MAWLHFAKLLILSVTHGVRRLRRFIGDVPDRGLMSDVEGAALRWACTFLNLPTDL
jgi:hypothetical protein